jgi:hypothetical protein
MVIDNEINVTYLVANSSLVPIIGNLFMPFGPHETTRLAGDGKE